VSKAPNRPKRTDNAPKGIEIDLGLAISGATLVHGQYRDLNELAAYCNCSKQMIHYIEKKAIRKVRKALLEKLENE
jgi:hypothetical protein